LSSYVRSGKNKGSNRHSLDIIRDMLSVASVKVRKTRIMYQSNLSFLQVEKYLRSLLENGLLYHDDDCHYLVTQKGLEFLRLYDEYVERCRQIQQQLDRSAREKLLLEEMCLNFEGNGRLKAIRKVAVS